MTNNIVPISNANVPSLMRQRMAAGRGLSSNFSDGVRDSFNILSIKGKVFRARINGEEQALIDPNTRAPVPFLDVVLVNAGRHLSKTYYKKGFTEGEMDAPDCWSLDSIKPDASIASKVSVTCANCPMNQFGSRVTENGKAAKACQDARRVAVMMPSSLGQENPPLFLLRIPQSSLKNLKTYAELLSRHGIEPNGVVSRLQFDYQEAYPKLMFNFVNTLNDKQYEEVIDIAERPSTSLMLAAPDFDNAQSAAPVQDDQSRHTGLGGLSPQAAPIISGLQTAGVAVDQAAQVAQPVQQQVHVEPVHVDPVQQNVNMTATQAAQVQPAAPVQAQAQQNIIALPDGRFFDTVSQQYVEPKQPEREIDPTVIKLPDGQFFSTTTQQFVTGPYKGDPVATAAAPKATRTRKKKEDAAPVEQAAQPVQQQVQQAAPVQQEVPAVQQVASADDTDAVQPGVSAAPPGLDALLSELMPN